MLRFQLNLGPLALFGVTTIKYGMAKCSLLETANHQGAPALTVEGVTDGAASCAATTNVGSYLSGSTPTKNIVLAGDVILNHRVITIGGVTTLGIAQIPAMVVFPLVETNLYIAVGAIAGSDANAIGT